MFFLGLNNVIYKLKIAELCFFSLLFRRKMKGYRQVVALANGICLGFVLG